MCRLVVYARDPFCYVNRTKKLHTIHLPALPDPEPHSISPHFLCKRGRGMLIAFFHMMIRVFCVLKWDYLDYFFRAQRSWSDVCAGRTQQQKKLRVFRVPSSEFFFVGCGAVLD